jgi:hypothetical protein
MRHSARALTNRVLVGVVVAVAVVVGVSAPSADTLTGLLASFAVFHFCSRSESQKCYSLSCRYLTCVSVSVAGGHLFLTVISGEQSLGAQQHVI